MKAIAGVIGAMMLFCAATAHAGIHHRHHASACSVLGAHSAAAHDCVYVSEGGIANNCTTTEIQVVCPVITEYLQSYSGYYVVFQGYDSNPSVNVSGQVFAKGTNYWTWTNCGSAASSSGTGNFDTEASMCYNYAWTTDYYGLRVTLPRKYGTSMSFLYGYTTANVIE